jgi:elongator complex protein 1
MGDEEARQVVAFTVIADTRTLCVITRSGDIAVLPLDDASDDADAPQSLDIVGTLTPAPILAVALAPDSSLFVIITASDSSTTPSPTLHILSPTISLLSSAPLAAHAPSETPVTVGWGAKSTQFHGTLGKAAAQEAGEAGCTTTPDDDGDVRVGWRGDAQFFVVSVVEDGGEEVGPANASYASTVAQAYCRAPRSPSRGLNMPLHGAPVEGLLRGCRGLGVCPKRALGKCPREMRRQGIANSGI